MNVRMIVRLMYVHTEFKISIGLRLALGRPPPLILEQGDCKGTNFLGMTLLENEVHSLTGVRVRVIIFSYLLSPKKFVPIEEQIFR